MGLMQILSGEAPPAACLLSMRLLLHTKLDKWDDGQKVCENMQEINSVYLVNEPISKLLR